MVDEAGRVGGRVLVERRVARGGRRVDAGRGAVLNSGRGGHVGGKPANDH